MELRSERVSATFLDPRRGFERTSAELEVRVDPLSGRVCRLLPEGTIPAPARHDLQALARETRGSCPFCGDALERETPRLPPEVWREGRIRRGEAVLFPNLVPYAPWASVSVYSPDRHLLPIDELTPALLADNLSAQVAFARGVLAHDPRSTWISINANHLSPSGSSIVHPHLQGAAAPFASTAQRAYAELELAALNEYLELERRAGERLIAVDGDVAWLAPFAPSGLGEVQAFVPGPSSPAELDDTGTLARGISHVLGRLRRARLRELQPRALRSARTAAEAADRRARVLRRRGAFRRHVERASARRPGDRPRARTGRRTRRRAVRVVVSFSHGSGNHPYRR